PTTSAPSVTHFQVTASPTTVPAGSAVSVTVIALDANNNAVSGYTGTVYFTSSDGSASLPANYTFTAGNAGTYTFTGVVLRTAGSQTATVADTVNTSAAGSVTVTVSPAAASTVIENFESG